jgi:hypothetical protein
MASFTTGDAKEYRTGSLNYSDRRTLLSDTYPADSSCNIGPEEPPPYK